MLRLFDFGSDNKDHSEMHEVVKEWPALVNQVKEIHDKTDRNSNDISWLKAMAMAIFGTGGLGLLTGIAILVMQVLSS